MTTLLGPRTADKLAKLCGLFGSDHDGERAAAAQMADKLVKQHGLRWSDVISISRRVAIAAPISSADKIAFALRNIAALSIWERRFLYSVNGRRTLSPKQLAVLEQIYDKAKAYAEAA
jgi:hypothetical protein